MAEHKHDWQRSVMKSGEVWHICRTCGARREPDHGSRESSLCEYGCPYGSEEHEWRLLEWERTGRW